MLTPEYLDQLPDSVIALYQQAEMDILKDMARRILSVGEMTSTAEYQMRRLEAMGASREYIMHTVNKIVSPEENQTSDGWMFFYRAYGLADVYENKVSGIYLHHKA